MANLSVGYQLPPNTSTVAALGDFPVAMTASTKYDVMFMVTKLGTILVFDTKTGTTLWSNQINMQPIFTATAHDATGGIAFVTLGGKILSVTLDEDNIIEHIAVQLGNIEIASRLSAVNKLPGATIAPALQHKRALKQLGELGMSPAASKLALEMCNNNVQAAMNWLLDEENSAALEAAEAEALEVGATEGVEPAPYGEPEPEPELEPEASGAHIQEGMPQIDAAKLRQRLANANATRSTLQTMGEDTSVIDADIATMKAELVAAGALGTPTTLPPIPYSPVSGRSLAKSNFKVAYAKAKAPNSAQKLGQKLADVIKYYCSQQQPKIPYDDGDGERFFDELIGDTNADDSIAQSVQRMWTSFKTLRGKELCFMLNDVTRNDPIAAVAPAAALTRAINQLCVTSESPRLAIHPPGNVCYRGGGFDDSYRDFFAAGREFRQPAFLATSFSEDKAREFIRMRGEGVCALWLVRIDPVRKCQHVNLVTRRVPHLPDEQEYLFAPYSAFKVLSATWTTGTTEDPHIIELMAAPDNRGPSEALPLAPWS